MTLTPRPWLIACVLLFFHPASKGEEPATAFRRPELVAIMPAPENGQQYQGSAHVAWRADGTPVPVEELDWLFESRNLDTQNSFLRMTQKPNPLILIFRVDEHGKREQWLQVGLMIEGKPVVHQSLTMDSGFSHARSSKDHLAAFRLMPPPALADWPPHITLEVTTQCSDAAVLKRLDAAQVLACTPENPLQVDNGVTWRIEPTRRGPNGRLIQRLAVLSVDREVADPECHWSVDAPRELRKPLLITEIRANGSRIEYGCSLDDDQQLDPLEFLRRRFRKERFEHVRTHQGLVEN